MRRVALHIDDDHRRRTTPRCRDRPRSPVGHTHPGEVRNTSQRALGAQRPRQPRPPSACWSSAFVIFERPRTLRALRLLVELVARSAARALAVAPDAAPAARRDVLAREPRRLRASPLRARSLFTVRAAISSAVSSDAPRSRCRVLDVLVLARSLRSLLHATWRHVVLLSVAYAVAYPRPGTQTGRLPRAPGDGNTSRGRTREGGDGVHQRWSSRADRGRLAPDLAPLAGRARGGGLGEHLLERHRRPLSVLAMSSDEDSASMSRRPSPRSSRSVEAPSARVPDDDAYTRVLERRVDVTTSSSVHGVLDGVRARFPGREHDVLGVAPLERQRLEPRPHGVADELHRADTGRETRARAGAARRAARGRRCSAMSSPRAPLPTTCSRTCSRRRSGSFGPPRQRRRSSARPSSIDRPRRSTRPSVYRTTTLRRAARSSPAGTSGDPGSERQAAGARGARRGRPGMRRAAAGDPPTTCGRRPSPGSRTSTRRSRTRCRARRPRADQPRERGRRLQPLDGERAYRVSQLPHARGRLDPLSDDVADDETELAVGKLDRVEPVSADVELCRARAGTAPRAARPRHVAATTGRTLRWSVSAIVCSDSKCRARSSACAAWPASASTIARSSDARRRVWSQDASSRPFARRPATSGTRRSVPSPTVRPRPRPSEAPRLPAARRHRPCDPAHAHGPRRVVESALDRCRAGALVPVVARERTVLHVLRDRGQHDLRCLDGAGHFVDDDPRDVAGRQGVREEAVVRWRRSARRRNRCSSSYSASLERLTALQDHRLEPLALALAELPGSPKREVKGAARAAHSLQRDRRPSPPSAASCTPVKAAISSGDRAHTGSPERDRPCEGHVVVGADAPRGQLASSSASHELEIFEPCRLPAARRSPPPHRRSERVLEARVAHLDRVVARESAAVTSCSRRVESARAADLVLGAAALELLERETRLVGEAADDRDRRRVRLGDHDCQEMERTSSARPRR